MKTIFRILPFLFMLTCLPVITSCGDDDDEKGEIGGESIIGTWVCIYEYSREKCPEDDPYTYEENYDVDAERDKMTIKKGGSVVTEDGSASWKLNGQQLSITIPGEDTGTVTITKLTSTEMTVEFSETDEDGCTYSSKMTYKRI